MKFRLVLANFSFDYFLFSRSIVIHLAKWTSPNWTRAAPSGFTAERSASFISSSSKLKRSIILSIWSCSIRFVLWRFVNVFLDVSGLHSVDRRILVPPLRVPRWPLSHWITWEWVACTWSRAQGQLCWQQRSCEAHEGFGRFRVSRVKKPLRFCSGICAFLVTVVHWLVFYSCLYLWGPRHLRATWECLKCEVVQYYFIHFS